MTAKQDSQSYRKANSDKFRDLGGGKFGGYKKGVQNGPLPRRKPRNKK